MDKFLSEGEKLELSDSDSDDGLDVNNLSYYDTLELIYYPEPYNKFGQFILSTVVGISMTYIKKNKEIDINKLVDLYFTYCLSVDNNDNYLNEIFDNLDKGIILDKSKEYVNELLNNTLIEDSDTELIMTNKILKLIKLSPLHKIIN
jgi:hypothetical protein